MLCLVIMWRKNDKTRNTQKKPILHFYSIQQFRFTTGGCQKMNKSLFQKFSFFVLLLNRSFEDQRPEWDQIVRSKSIRLQFNKSVQRALSECVWNTKLINDTLVFFDRGSQGDIIRKTGSISSQTPANNGYLDRYETVHFHP